MTDVHAKVFCENGVNMYFNCTGVANVSVTAQTIHIGASCEGPADPSESNRKDTIVRSFTVEVSGQKQKIKC